MRNFVQNIYPKQITSSRLRRPYILFDPLHQNWCRVPGWQHQCLVAVVAVVVVAAVPGRHDSMDVLRKELHPTKQRLPMQKSSSSSSKPLLVRLRGWMSVTLWQFIVVDVQTVDQSKSCFLFVLFSQGQLVLIVGLVITSLSRHFYFKFDVSVHFEFQEKKHPSQKISTVQKIDRLKSVFVYFQ